MKFGDKTFQYIKKGGMIMSVMFLVYIAYDVGRMLTSDSERSISKEGECMATMTDTVSPLDAYGEVEEDIDEEAVEVVEIEEK